ncbi:hypothetical protein C8Q78DRAFT_1008009 [Trametes maxima]|nr:hypothetical protein C8Q78DRAFT_1008009 [Trametes maxima]
MLLHPPQPSSSSAIAHYNLLPAPRPAPLPPRATPRSLAAVDRLPLQPPNPTLRADVHRLPDSPLAHPHNYHYVPRPLPVHSSDSPDAMYHQPHHVQPHLYDQHPHSTHPNPTAPPPNPEPDFDPPRQQPPSIHTDNLLYPTESGDYSPSPLSSPSDNQNAFPPRYTNEQEPPRFPFPTQTLDRRMSEPVLGAGRQAYAQLPPPAPHDTFAYSAASSTTVIQPSPVSPRPSSSYSYGSYPGHERDNSGASIGSGGAPDAYPSSAWGAGIKHADLDQETALASSPLSPLYAASAASGSDASATGLPSPPIQSRPSPSRQMAQLSGRTMPAPPTSSNTPRVAGNSKTYSFVSLPGNAVKKRPRRRYDEIERLYQCRCAPFFASVSTSRRATSCYPCPIPRFVRFPPLNHIPSYLHAFFHTPLPPRIFHLVREKERITEIPAFAHQLAGLYEGVRHAEPPERARHDAAARLEAQPQRIQGAP